MIYSELIFCNNSSVSAKWIKANLLRRTENKWHFEFCLPVSFTVQTLSILNKMKNSTLSAAYVAFQFEYDIRFTAPDSSSSPILLYSRYEKENRVSQ